MPQQNDRVEVGCAWENTSKAGDTYLSGKLNMKLLLFRNKYKEPGSSQPDFRIYAVPVKKEEPRSQGCPSQHQTMSQQEFFDQEAPF